MKNYEVVIKKPTTVSEYSAWEEEKVQKYSETTTAIVVAFNEQRLKVKLDKFYPGFKIISIKEIEI